MLARYFDFLGLFKLGKILFRLLLWGRKRLWGLKHQFGLLQALGGWALLLWGRLLKNYLLAHFQWHLSFFLFFWLLLNFLLIHNLLHFILRLQIIQLKNFLILFLIIFFLVPKPLLTFFLMPPVPVVVRLFSLFFMICVPVLHWLLT